MPLEGAESPRDAAHRGARPASALGLVGIFEDLNQNLPARAARENLRKFACLRAVTRRSNVELSTRYKSTRTVHTRHTERISTESVRAESAAAQSELRKATARAASLATARIAADEKARQLREAADRLAAPKSD